MHAGACSALIDVLIYLRCGDRRVVGALEAGGAIFGRFAIIRRYTDGAEGCLAWLPLLATSRSLMEDILRARVASMAIIGALWKTIRNVKAIRPGITRVKSWPAITAGDWRPQLHQTIAEPKATSSRPISATKDDFAKNDAASQHRAGARVAIWHCARSEIAKMAYRPNRFCIAGRPTSRAA